MDDRHARWIAAYLSENNPYGRCKQASEAMQATFPELRIAKGHVHCDWGQRSHWWLVTADGEIVDPTATQFRAIFSYEEWQPNDKVRVGKCMDCGDEIWEAVAALDAVPRRSFCNAACEKRFAQYLRI